LARIAAERGLLALISGVRSSAAPHPSSIPGSEH
jgi:hypothetical protein